ncbi:hypothetical protein [Pseudomonas sp. HTZ2]|uniref:hypothetical protein n=1 Tax=Pseudomonas sp. HTZ2 TaxID=3075220 RepID=UPI0029583B01|nr:hypothetical protein [Pseudomonas sp. HTZ2]
MKVVPPVEITDAKIVSYNVPENDYPEWTAGTYTQGTRRIIAANHLIYEVLAASTTDSPTDGVAKATPTWMIVSPTNRWKMFNKRNGNTWMIGTATTNPESIDITIRPGQRINSIGLVGVLATTLQVQMIVGGQVIYDVTQSMSSKDSNSSWYQYYFGPFVTRVNFARLDLPAQADADIRVIASSPGGTAQIGMLVMGWARELGWARWGTGLGFDSYSSVKEDDFGNVTITPRGGRDSVDFDVAMYTNQVSTAKRVLTEVKDTAALYVGSEIVDPTIIVGRFDRFSLVLSNVAISEYSLEVRSLM